MEVKIVSPVYRIGEHDFLVVETSVGRQAFYRSSGVNSGMRGKWFPFDEILPWDGHLHKETYTQGPGLKMGSPLHRLGSEEFAQISKKLGELPIPEGYQVPAGQNEVAGMTVNRLLDFFRCRITPAMLSRPVPEE